MLDLRAHLRLGAIVAALSIAERVIARGFLLREVLRVPSALADHFALAAIGRVTP